MTKITFDTEIHSTLAQIVYPYGVMLRCKQCGRTAKAPVANCEDYMSHGWPRCCGRTMAVRPLVDNANALLWAIAGERIYQQNKYGDDAARGLSLAVYHEIIQAELAEVGHAIGHLDADAAKLEILQVLAVCWACLEQHGVVERD